MCRVIYTRKLSKTIIHQHSQPDIVPSPELLGLPVECSGGFYSMLGFDVCFVGYWIDLKASITCSKGKGWGSLLSLKRERERERGDQIRIENMNGAVTSEAVSVTTLECQLSIGVVRPANTPQCWRDELCLVSFSQPSAALQSPLSQSHPATFLVRSGFYSQLNISTENLIRICKTLGRVENVIIRYRVMVVSGHDETV